MWRPVLPAAQIGHVDAAFTLRVYAAAKHRNRLTGAHRAAYDRAIEWARMGTDAHETSDELILRAETGTRLSA